MADPIRFTPQATLDANDNLEKFVELVKTHLTLLRPCNRFEDNAWNIEGLGQRGGSQKFLYFTQAGIIPKQHYPNGKRGKCSPAEIPKQSLLRKPFLNFAKAILAYLHLWENGTNLPSRIASLRHLEAALQEINGSTCPTALTPEVLNRACIRAAEIVSPDTAYDRGKQLEMIYRYMVNLGLVTVPDEWVCPLKSPQQMRNRVGMQFDAERQKKLPNPQVLEALATIFNSDSRDSRDIFATSVCALMLCDPDRSVEVLYSPKDILTPDWIDPETGEIGTGLRWHPAKGSAPMIKTVIPSMREVAIRAIDRLLKLSEPARVLAKWYEQNPDRIYLPPNLEYLREHERLTQDEIYAILFAGQVVELSDIDRNRVRAWIKLLEVPHISIKGVTDGKPVTFADLERGVLRRLPAGFPVMDPKTGMRYSDALCIARIGEFDPRSKASNCCFDRINYSLLSRCLKSNGHVISILERWGFRDENGEFLFLNTHMLRHYLNTLVRQSGKLTEEEIAEWSGRKRVNQNATYNHQSDRDVIAKLRNAVGDPSKSVGPFTNIDNRVFIRREEFASIKVITAHTSEYGHCLHDYAQSHCQVHQDCMNCNEQVCIKGDARAEENLRKTQTELIRLQKDAREAFSEDILGAADWFKYQTKTLERVNQLLAIIDDPEIPQGAVIQLSGVLPPSRLAMAEKSRQLLIKPISQTIASLDEVRALLKDSNNYTQELDYAE